MSPKRQTSKRLSATLLCCVLLAAAWPGLAKPEQKGLESQLLAWLPDSQARLNLAFAYRPGNAEESKSSKDLRKATDRLRATLTLLTIRTSPGAEPRVIGGYNPLPWKSRFGRYQRNPGLYIFDLTSEERWYRQTKPAGFTFKRPSEFALSFGRGDLAILSDLKTGAARDFDFAPPSDKSILLGKAGTFTIEAIEVYEVIRHEPPPLSNTLFAAQNSRISPSGGSPHSVPDSGSLPLELLAIAALAAAARRIVRKKAS